MTTLAWSPETFEISRRYRVVRASGPRVFSRSVYPSSQPSRLSYACRSDLMLEADRDELVRVWGLTSGSAGTFQWTPPTESSARTCRFVGSELVITESSAGHFQTQIEIEVI